SCFWYSSFSYLHGFESAVVFLFFRQPVEPLQPLTGLDITSTGANQVITGSRKLNTPNVSVGSMIGVRVYILVGIVAQEHPVDALLSKVRIIIHTSVLEKAFWIIGWDLILEHTIGGPIVALGISPNLVKNPQRDLPLGIGDALSICCMLYMLVSVIIVGLVPFYAMDLDTPIPSAFSSQGIQWAPYIITTGAVIALCSTLMGSVLPRPRILMAMDREGLLASFFSDVNKRTQVPIKSTILTGTVAAT
ncbi:cationic amino acid transporter 2, vacuolar-like protein, partial [Tanacetum coccineum]